MNTGISGIPLVGADVLAGRVVVVLPNSGTLLALELKPVATTVICTLSPKFSSITEPKIMFASGSAASEMISAASLISNKLKLELPVMLSKIPFAPSIEVSNY